MMMCLAITNAYYILFVNGMQTGAEVVALCFASWGDVDAAEGGRMKGAECPGGFEDAEELDVCLRESFFYQ